jgi:hypothetical protein
VKERKKGKQGVRKKKERGRCKEEEDAILNSYCL